MVPLFGTDGIRGIAGRDFFSRPSLVHFAETFSLWIKRHFPNTPGVIIIADTRISGDWIKSCISSVFLIRGIPIYDAGILPTPAAQTLLEHHPKCSVVLIISASHNPAKDNGIKIVLRTGKMTSQEEQSLEELLQNKTDLSEKVQFAHLQKIVDAELMYQATVLSPFKPTLLTGITIALDCAHGATYKVAPAIFSSLGANVILCNARPNGTNINESCGSQFPQDLQKTVLDYKADIGFAFDGDGDRVIAVSKTGEIKDGDDLLVILSQHHQYSSEKIVIGTHLSNKGCENYFINNGKTFIRAAVGDKYVAQKMEETNALLGGEPAGHLILANFLKSGDGIRAALMVLDQIITTHNWELATFTKYPQVHASIPVVHRFDLSTKPFFSLLQKAEVLTMGGRVLVRYSGTEPILRIMVESLDLHNAEKTASFLTTSFTKLFSSI